MEFKVIIAGSRDFNNYDLLVEKCDLYFSNRKPTAIICGMARGADLVGKHYAEDRGIEVLEFPADWKQYGKRAGYLRNQQMLEHADALVAFWDGQSRGTKNMIEIARAAEIPVRVVYYSREEQ